MPRPTLIHGLTGAALALSCNGEPSDPGADPVQPATTASAAGSGTSPAADATTLGSSPGSSNSPVAGSSGATASPGTASSDAPSVEPGTIGTSAPTSAEPTAPTPTAGGPGGPSDTAGADASPSTSDAPMVPSSMNDGAVTEPSDPGSVDAGSEATPPSPDDAETAAPDTADADWVPDPSWACGASDGLPPPELGELVLSATLELGQTHDFGATPYGHRRLRDVTGGAFISDALEGEVLTGGLDLELTLPNQSVELEQINILRASDGALILLRNCGFAPSSDLEVRFSADFEAPNASDHAWLNDGEYVGVRSVDEATGVIELSIYDVAGVASERASVTLEDPADTPHQPSECAAPGGSRGAEVFTENVTLGASLSVGESKRGTRNIIPITGGSVSGRFVGSVLPGGADYQILSGGATLDARYTLVSEDGEYVLVRNCGPFGALIPQFETRADGPYAFLNDNSYLSSDPSAGAGGVSLTFYERQ